MQTWEIVIILFSTFAAFGLIAGITVALTLAVRETGKRSGEKLGVRVRNWFVSHKPSKRRLIQVYAALLSNANIRGFVTGTIYTGNTKYACLPGLNCYSCPGATGACPLGALQNALASTGTRAPYYVFGILMLFGVLLARTICGFLCPVGLGQDLLYKIKTPKVKKSRVTRVFSYFKYVLLAVFVFTIPLMFGLIGDSIAVPAFCKYICPAGTLGGAVGLLVNPNNANMYGMLGGLFTWKFLVLILVMTLCVFFYRFFCRFLCPLGALYSLFNRISLLGVKLDKNKCTDCGLCVAHCKMDIKRVGDHECINCGECISVCPAKAISWKGSRFFVHANAVEPAAPSEERPLGGVLKSAAAAEVAVPENQSVLTAAAAAPTVTVVMPSAENSAMGAKKLAKKRGKTFWLQFAAWAAALALLAGALVYYNFLAVPVYNFSEYAATHYFFTVQTADGSAGEVNFTVAESGAGEPHGMVFPQVGEGTEEEPYILDHIAGTYSLEVEKGEKLWFVYEPEESISYTVTPAGDNLGFSLWYYSKQMQEIPLLSIEGGTAERTVTLTKLSEFGNEEWDLCYDFTLDSYLGREAFSLSAHRGKVVIINFWGTWCGPCVEEMPYIAEVAEKYKDDVDVVAIHSARITEQNGRDGVEQWLSRWADYNITFVQDVSSLASEDSAVYYMLGGINNTYPMTLIIDREGIINFVRIGSLEKGMLERELSFLI